MNKFNQVIRLEVEVDTIADRLLETMDKSNPHSELIAETIIGTMLEKGGLGMLYHSLNGKVEEINLQVGKDYACPMDKLSLYRRVENLDKALCFEIDGVLHRVVTVIQTNKYKDRDYNTQVKFMYYRMSGLETDVNDVCHLALKELTPEMLDALATSMSGVETDTDGPKVVGKIDLSNIDSSTRPK